MLALGAVAIAVGSLIALFIAETSLLFGFSEDGYDTPVVIAIVSEVATVVPCGGEPRGSGRGGRDEWRSRVTGSDRHRRPALARVTR